MKPLLEIIKLSAAWLEKKGVQSPRLEAELLIAHVLGIKRLDLYVQYDRPLDESEMASLRALLEQRGRRVPLQYILGEVEFMDCRIKVSPAVLIPRPETEILAEKVINALPEEQEGVLWDVCTGSGCLGIAIKKKRPHLKVVLSDLSSAACELARANAALNGVDVEVMQGDLLAPFGQERAHFVVSNPPYIRDDEFAALQPEVKDHEPKGALTSGPTGLEFYERFSAELPSKLFSNAKVWFELGPKEAEAYFTGPEWSNRVIESDWSGLPRFLLLNFKEDFRILST